MERKIDERILKGKNKTGSLVNLVEYSSDFIETKNIPEKILDYLANLSQSNKVHFEKEVLSLSKELSKSFIEEISSYIFSNDFNLNLELYFKKGLIKKYAEILPSFVDNLIYFLNRNEGFKINSYILPISLYSWIDNKDKIDSVVIDDYFLPLYRKRKDKIKFRNKVLDLFSTFNFKKIKTVIFPLSTSLDNVENTKIAIEAVREYLLEKNKIGCRIYYTNYKVESLKNLNTPILSCLLGSDFTYYTNFFGKGGSKENILRFNYLKNFVFVEETTNAIEIKNLFEKNALRYGISEERFKGNLLKLKALEKGVLTKVEFKKLFDFLNGLFKIEEFILNNKFKETQEELNRLPEFSKIKQKIENLGK